MLKTKGFTGPQFLNFTQTNKKRKWYFWRRAARLTIHGCQIDHPIGIKNKFLFFFYINQWFSSMVSTPILRFLDSYAAKSGSNPHKHWRFHSCHIAVIAVMPLRGLFKRSFKTLFSGANSAPRRTRKTWPLNELLNKPKSLSGLGLSSVYSLLTPSVCFLVLYSFPTHRLAYSE